MKPDFARVVDACRRSLGDGLISVVLFGSQARQEARRDSDWDVFVLASGLPNDLFERQLFLRDIIFAQRLLGISFMARTREEFEANLLPIYLDIAADGIILFDRGGYMAMKMEEARRIAQAAGLKRAKKRGAWQWEWERQPPPGNWAINWENL